MTMVRSELLDTGVARITLERPEALNAWTRAFGEDLRAAVEHAVFDPAARAIMITGAGRAFSAGADLKSGREFGPDGRPDVLSRLREVYNPLLALVRAAPKPVLAAVNGPAVGIGCSLALACDLTIAAEDAYFLLAFINIGLGLDGGLSVTLPARIGHARAFEMAYLGRRIDAPRALAWGLINEAVPREELVETAERLAGDLASRPPGAGAAIKAALNRATFSAFEGQLDFEAVLQQARAESEEFAEAVASFGAKRTGADDAGRHPKRSTDQN